MGSGVGLLRILNRGPSLWGLLLSRGSVVLCALAPLRTLPFLPTARGMALGLVMSFLAAVEALHVLLVLALLLGGVGGQCLVFGRSTLVLDLSTFILNNYKLFENFGRESGRAETRASADR